MENMTIEEAGQILERLKSELGRAVIGQQEVVEQLAVCLFAGGHALLTGVPGLGKTLLVKSIARLFALTFRRIQFTPDLMPSDIFGTEVLEEDPQTGKRDFRFLPGPVFANLVLADEINRTPPKTQAALLEAMGEGHVTAGRQTRVLEQPFFVLATQNPIELEGTYPLPEAQLDRFLLNIVMDYLPQQDEVTMVKQTTALGEPDLKPILDAPKILALQQLVRQVAAPDNVVSYAVRLCAATRPNTDTASPEVRTMVQWGAGSRASQAMVLAGKARALLAGRYNVACEDIRALAIPILRHRVIPNFRASAEGKNAVSIIQTILKTVSE
ncbi:MAG: MoxR family ATPase [Victivallales bacterium]|nr:MoxR family ATPase [Victivallales bacterium]